MEARLGVTTCDKCGKLMKKGQPILVIAEGDVTESGDELTFRGSCVRYACNLGCWDGIEKNGFAAQARNKYGSGRWLRTLRNYCYFLSIMIY